MTRGATLTILAAAALTSLLDAQAAASKSHFLSSVELVNGTNATSANYHACTAIGGGVTPAAAASANYKIPGGFKATLDVPTIGAPWLTAVTPRFVTPKGAATLTLHGIGLKLGPTPNVTVDGVSTPVISRENHRITASMPFFAGPPSKPAPGWRPVRVSNTAGTSELPQGVGVLPMLMADGPAPKKAFDIVFKGSPGDQVFWVVAALPTAAPIPLPGFLHGLAVNPLAMIQMPPLTIGSFNGERHFAVPPTAYVGPLYVQGLFSTSNPGYGPASFSNVLRL